MSAKDGKHRDEVDDGEPKPRLPLKKRIAAIRSALLAKISPRLEAPRRLVRTVRQRPMLSSSIVLGSAAILVSLVTAWLIVYERTHRRPAVLPLASVLARLDAGDFEAARDQAAKLFAHGSQSDSDLGGALYVIGIVTFRDAEIHDEWPERKKLYLLTTRYLEEARNYGFPESHKIDALESLAQSYFNLGRFAKALPLLRDALDEPTNYRKHLLWMQTTAYRLDANPQWKKALDSNREFLEQPDLEEEEKYDGSLLQAQLLFQVGDYKGCREQLKVVEQSAKMSAELIVIRGRLLMQDAERLLNDPQLRQNDTQQVEAAKKFEEAIDILKTAKSYEATGNEATRQAAYLLAICWKKLGDDKAAEQQFARTHSAFLGTPESVACGLGEAEMQRQRGQDEESLKSYLRVLKAVGAPDEYSNSWVSLNEFRTRIEQAYFAYAKAQHFALAIDLAQAMVPLFPLTRSVQLRAEAQRSWATVMVEEADALSRSEAQKILAEARVMFRQAGNSFWKLAKLRAATEELGADIWAAGECYLKGHDYDRAINLIERYLTQESRKNRPTALVALAEAQLARNRLGLALKPVLECLEFHLRDPESYRARVVAGKIYLELGNLAEAKQMLLANVESETLTPQSAEWRDAIFMLGKLLHHEADSQLTQVAPLFEVEAPQTLEEVKQLEATHLLYVDAVQRMAEALRRFPHAPQAVETRYFIAESHRQLVRWPKAKLRTTVLETTRTAMQREIETELLAAAEEYRILRDALSERMDRHDLSPVEISILRNCVFARADMLFELKQYREAIDEYSLAVARYQNEPEVLEALVQIANCLRATGQADEARGTLKQAQYILQRIPAEKPFEKTTRYSREGWNQLLTLMAAL